jgi:hypothetical protein
MVNITSNALVHITDQDITLYLPYSLNRHAKAIIQKRLLHDRIQSVQVIYTRVIGAKEYTINELNKSLDEKGGQDFL